MEPIRRANAGDRPLRLRARDWNRIADAVEGKSVKPALEPETPMLGGSKPAGTCPQTTVLVRNESDEDVPRFGVLDIGAPIISSVDNPDEFKNRFSLKGLMPLGPTRHGVVLVAQEPMAEDKVGRCVSWGTTVALVKVRDTNHTHAELESGKTVLQSAFAGPAKILWLAPVDPELEEEEPDIRLALVMLGEVERTFDGVVTDKAPVVTDEKWLYTVQERVYLSDGTMSSSPEGLREVSATSKLEIYNVAGTRTAPGIKQTDHEDTVLTTLPIDVGCPVQVHEVFPVGWERGDPPLYFINPLPNPLLIDCMPEEEDP